MNKEKDEAVTTGRRRRSVLVRLHGRYGNQVVELRPGAKNVIAQYLEWRRNNGYGQFYRRWGK